MIDKQIGCSNNSYKGFNPLLLTKFNSLAYVVDNELSANGQGPESRMDKIVAFRVPLLVSTFQFGQGAGSDIFFDNSVNGVPHNHSRIPANIPKRYL